MTDDARATAAQKMTRQFLAAVAVQKNDIIAGYWPVRGEIDVLPLLAILTEGGHICALPCVQGKGRPLVFRAWTPDSPVEMGVFGINHPTFDSPVVIPDVLIVPMAGFDRKKHRLGYGAGYYDRTLASLKQAGRALAIGVAYEAQFLDDIPAEAHDQRLDMIVTDKAVYQ